jgi:hypothetical protein
MEKLCIRHCSTAKQLLQLRNVPKLSEMALHLLIIHVKDSAAGDRQGTESMTAREEERRRKKGRDSEDNRRAENICSLGSATVMNSRHKSFGIVRINSSKTTEATKVE